MQPGGWCGYVRRFAGAAVLLVCAAGSARADLTASYDGSLTNAHGVSATLAAALTQASVALSGTIALEGAAPAFTGVYWVNGQVRGPRVVLAGTNSAGTRFTRPAVAQAEAVVRGRVKLKTAGGKLKGLLVLTRRSTEPPPNPPASCDNSFFTGQVMGRVLQPICANCHTAGGAAQTANFRVTVGDPLATQESVALHIDRTTPAESRILKKPLALVPHAGGQQLAQGSEELQILEQWVNLVATDQQCSGTPDVALVPLAPAELLVRASMAARGLRP